MRIELNNHTVLICESEAARMGADKTHPRKRTQVDSAVLPR